MVVHANRDIQPGEEITANYIGRKETFVKMDPVFTYCSVGINREGYLPIDTFQDVRNMLRAKWGIVCPPSCFCRTKGLDSLLAEGQKELSLISYEDKEMTKTDVA